MNCLIKKLLLLSSVTIFLSSCGGSVESDKNIKIICPKGAPALAFYDQGKQSNFVTSSNPVTVLSQLQKNEYDCVVFDSVNGLKSIKANNANYGLAKVITGGNFYLACINKTPDEKGNYPLPSENDVVVSFGQNLIPDLVYSRLCSEYWHIKNNAKYVSSVEDALAVLVSGKYSGGNADYVFIAEPALTIAMNKKDAETYGKVGIARNIRSEWKAYSGQDGLAQAAIFVNKKIISSKNSQLKEIFSQINNRINTAIDKPEKVKEEMETYGSSSEQQSRFGFTGEVAYNVQFNRNGFGLVKESEKIDVNSFLTSLGQETFSSEYFVTI